MEKRKKQKMTAANRPIAVFDSGIGGVSFLWQLRQTLPQEDVIYYADLAHAPYGDKTKDFLIQRLLTITAELRERQIKGLVMACNTATSAAVEVLRQTHPDLIILGMEPAIQLAVNQGEKKVVVLSTAVTSQAENTLALLAKNQGRAEFINLGCPGLMELVETVQQEPSSAHWGDIQSYLIKTLAPHLQKDEEAGIVLGCTHYIFLKKQLRQQFPHCRLYDGNEGTANHLQRQLAQKNWLRQQNQHPRLLVESSADAAALQERIEKALQQLTAWQS